MDVSSSNLRFEPFENLPALSAGNAWLEYLNDAYQRSILFLDILRQRGDQQASMAARPMATVLRYKQEQLMSGYSFARPMNYSLSRIIPPEGMRTNPRKRPVVVVDPRAGQGPGIGGFKKESEIGDALAAGHSVYFIGFTAEPVPGQRFLDVVEGQVKFFEEVVRRHPNAPKPMAIGNCQAGYQTLMVAMLRPDLFGPCLIVGSPMSYWQGVRGKNPMRYSGGLFGGSWMTALTSDLGAGRFDGAWLVENFDNLNPANWLWGKQYNLYEKADTEGPRYLEFEKWWGSFIMTNGDEMQYLVDELFVGDKLTHNQLLSSDGKLFDLRNISSPIICFTSFADDISPPQQTLGWILDVYRDIEDIYAQGKTIVYCLDQKAGHLALFVSSRVAKNQDEQFIQLIDIIDCLPPGLYEMIVTPNDHGEAKLTPESSVTFEPRSLDDIGALGRNSPEDDRAFQTVERLSELNYNIYRTFFQAGLRALANNQTAALTRDLHPLRLSYSLFTSRSPGMQEVAKLAGRVREARQPVSPSNPFWQWQGMVSAQIEAALKAFGDTRDAMVEQLFFAIFGSAALQSLLQMSETEKSTRRAPALTHDRIAAWEKEKSELATRLTTGTFEDAIIRAALFIIGSMGSMDSRTALTLNEARQSMTKLTLAEFKALVRTQASILRIYRDQALEALPDLVPSEAKRNELLRTVRAGALAIGPILPAEEECLSRLTEFLRLERGAAKEARQAAE
ncbi:MAG: DUF3141 domain-containing protein [Rhodomicrobium sp.]